MPRRDKSFKSVFLSRATLNTLAFFNPVICLAVTLLAKSVMRLSIDLAEFEIAVI